MYVLCISVSTSYLCTTFASTYCVMLQQALERLQMEYVDLIFCHRPDPVCPIEETVRAMNFVIDQGWAFYWVSVMQPPYDLSSCATCMALLHVPVVISQLSLNQLNPVA